MTHENIKFWLYLIALVPYLGCLLLYGLRSPWRKSAVGRSLFLLYSALTAVLMLAVIAQITDINQNLLDWLRGVTVGSVIVAGFIQFAIILKEQRRRKSCPHPLRRATD